MNLSVFLFLIVFFETVLIVVFLKKRSERHARAKSINEKFTFNLNPKPKFSTAKSDKFYVKQKTFIETPEVGVYLMRLFYVKEHMHTETSSMLYVLNGEANVSLGKKSFVIKPGDFLYVPANVVHHWEVLKQYEYVEYLEFNSPSFAQTGFGDTIWS